MEQAVLWLLRLHEREGDDGLVDAWQEWCQCDPLNQQVFDELAAIWEISGQFSTQRSRPIDPRHREISDVDTTPLIDVMLV